MRTLFTTLLFTCLLIGNAWGQYQKGDLKGTWKIKTAFGPEKYFAKFTPKGGSATNSEVYDFQILLLNSEGVSEYSKGVMDLKVVAEKATCTFIYDYQGTQDNTMDVTLNILQFKKISDKVIFEIEDAKTNGKGKFLKVGDLNYEIKEEVSEPTKPEAVAERYEPVRLKNAIITKITINKISPTKSDGAAWDTYMGNYKPDVYAILKSPQGNELWRSTGRHDDLDNARCPVSFSLSNVSGVKIPVAYFRNYYTVELWDMDNTSYHDSMINASFRIRDLGADAPQLYMNGGGFEIVLDISWD